MDIEHGLRKQLRAVAADHASRVSSIDWLDPLAINTSTRHEATTRKLLRTLRSITPTESAVCAEIEESEQRLRSGPIDFAGVRSFSLELRHPGGPG